MRRMICAALTALAALVAILAPSMAATAGATTRATGDPLVIMVVGDSISMGCTTTPMGGWCGGLDALLTARGIDHSIATHADYSLSCVALSAGFAARFNQIQPDLVILNCGTNDVPGTQAQRDYMGERWRTMVEYAWTHGAHILPTFVQYSNREINDEVGRTWLLAGEGAANDVIYVNMQYYTGAGWFVGLADLQKVPGDWNYLAGGTDGIHPNAFGYSIYAAIIYRAMRAHYGWPDDVPEPCGMWGHRTIYDPPAYTACTVMS